MKNKAAPATALLGLLAIFLTGCLPSCGYRETMRAHCRLEETTCNALFGSDTWKYNNQQELNTRAIAALDIQVRALKAQLDTYISDMDSLEFMFEQNQLALDALKDMYDADSEAIYNLTISQLTLSNRIEYLNVLITDIQMQIYNNSNGSGDDDLIVEYIDPCGNYPNYFDEVILKTKSGKYIAYFEDGGRRFLTILEKSKKYQTTDKQKCNFGLDGYGDFYDN